MAMRLHSGRFKYTQNPNWPLISNGGHWWEHDWEVHYNGHDINQNTDNDSARSFCIIYLDVDSVSFFAFFFLSFSDARIRYCLPAIACLASQGQDGFGSPYQSTGVPMWMWLSIRNSDYITPTTLLVKEKNARFDCQRLFGSPELQRNDDTNHSTSS